MKHIAAILGLALAGLFTTARGETLETFNWAGSVTNTFTSVETESFTSPNFTFDLPDGTYDVVATFGVTLSGAGTNTLSLAQPATTYTQSFINDQDAGVDVGGTSVTTGGGTVSYTFPAVSGTFSSLGADLTEANINTEFDLSPNVSASFSETLVIETVPEPSSVALSLIAGTAFAGLVVVRARRSRA